jgi:hypothetical protein
MIQNSRCGPYALTLESLNDQPGRFVRLESRNDDIAIVLAVDEKDSLSPVLALCGDDARMGTPLRFA